jgi:type I restriction enzyme S subunit
MKDELLGDICDFTYGESLRADRRQPGKVPVYGSNGIVGWHNRAVTKGTAVVIGRKGSIGEVHFSAVPCWPIDTTYYVDLPKKECDLRWLYYALVALDLTKLNKAAAVPGLNREDAYRERVIFPPLSEQRQIAAILEKADGLRRTRRYGRQLSDTFLQSVFLEMFGDLTANVKGWETSILGDLIVSGPQNGIYKPASAYGSGIPILRIDAFYNGVVTDITKLKRLRVNQREIDLYGLQENDFVINRVNSRSHLGKSALIPALREPTVFESNMMRLRTDPHRVHSIYMLHFLQTPFLNRQIQSAGKDAVNQASINQEDVENFQIRVPPLPLQQKFATVVRRFERLRAQQREAARQAEHLFQTLLHRAFSSSK